MNFYSAAVNTFRRLAARGRSRSINRSTCVFILVPAHVGANGHAKRVEVIQTLIDNGARFGEVRTESVIPSPIDRIDDCNLPDGSDEPQLNYDLMWTWFLPNPLWAPKSLR
jgi:hypothetical protein